MGQLGVNMSSVRKTISPLVMAVLVVLPGLIFLNYGRGLAELPDQKQELLKKLKDSAETFNRAYEKQDYKTMYQMLVPNYRERVPFWEYKDFVNVKGVRDGYIKILVVEAKLLRDGIHGKIIRKFMIFEKILGKSTGELSEKKEEFMEVQDWVLIKGTWYLIEKLNQ